MSYCVNCGVKLRSSEKKCPLCSTKVINPNKTLEKYEPAYSSTIEEFKKVNFKYIGKLIMLVSLLLTSVAVICNFVMSGTISWSIYVACATLYLNCHFSFILCKNIYIPLAIELICTQFFMFVVAFLNDGLHWYLYLVMPFIFIVWLYVILCTSLIKAKKGNVFRKISISFFFSSFTLLVIESGIDLYINDVIAIQWSLYAMLPIAIISLLIFILSYNRKLIEEVKQRMFI